MASKKAKKTGLHLSPSPQTHSFFSLVQESSKITFGRIEECLQDMKKLIDDLEKL